MDPVGTRPGRYADRLLTVQGAERYAETLSPAIDEALPSAGRQPSAIRRIRSVGVSYADDYETVLDNTAFSRGPRPIGFHQVIANPREIERRGREISFEEMADAWLLTIDPDILEE